MVKLTESIPGFVRLDETTSFYQPAKATGNGHAGGEVTQRRKQQEPDLLVFCSWMSAAPKHIAKYTAGYQKRFPNTAILLVEARLIDSFLGNDFPAGCSIIISYIEKKLPMAYRRPSILLHSCSNGGGITTSSLATKLKKLGYVAPFDTVTLDCSPGKGNFHATVRAIKFSLPPNPFFRGIGTLLVYLLMASYVAFITVSRRQDGISWIRETINDTTLLGVNVPRLYLYSRADLLVDVGDIHAHAEDASRKGCGDVREVVFGRAPHCALINEDAGRYWDAVEKLARTESKPYAESGWA